MKARPILMNGDMVRAILDGKKTQTRRVLKLPKGCFWVYDDLGTDGMWTDSNLDHGIWHAEEIACPYGQPGDLLWVRETFMGPLIDEEGGDYPDGYWSPEFCEYRADGGPAPEWVDADGEEHQSWAPSIRMPRWANRITLEITNVRVERLQDISEEDAKAEGCDNSQSQAAQNIGWYEKPRKAFQRLWDSIYGTWDANPWVWVVEFKPHMKNVDDFK